jgi:hypothetical protein
LAAMTYELINTITTNTLASFASEVEAREALERFRATDQKFGETLELVAFDDEGLAVDEEPGPAKPARAEVVTAFGHGRT